MALLVHRQLRLSHPPTYTDVLAGPAQHLTTVFTIIRWACNLISLRREDKEIQEMDNRVMVRRKRDRDGLCVWFRWVVAVIATYRAP